MVRNATFDDYDELLRMITTILNLNGYHEIDNSLLRRMFTICVDSGFAKVVEKDGMLKGCMFALASANYWGLPTASDLICYSMEDTHRLLIQYKRWAIAKGVKQITITNSFGDKKFERLITLLKFKPASTTFNIEV